MNLKLFLVKSLVAWKVISHVDIWVSNMLFKYDSSTGKPTNAMLLDLQIVDETCPTHDLLYLMFESTDSQFRKNYTNEILNLYVGSFNANCNVLKCPTLPGFSLEALKFRYHRGKLLGYYMANICLPMDLQE